MTQTIFQILNTNAVQSHFGTAPLRVFPFGKAPANVASPYAVHQLLMAEFENTLSCPPDLRHETTQIDIYGDESGGQAPVVAAAHALVQALFPHGTVPALLSHGQDPDTKEWRIGIDFSRIVDAI